MAETLQTFDPSSQLSANNENTPYTTQKTKDFSHKNINRVPKYQQSGEPLKENHVNIMHMLEKRNFSINELDSVKRTLQFGTQNTNISINSSNSNSQPKTKPSSEPENKPTILKFR